MDISYLGLLFSMLLLVFPLIIFHTLKLKLSKQLMISFGRMIGQLAIVGLWLQFLLDQEDWRLTLLWAGIMLINAIFTVKGRLKSQLRILLPVMFSALGIASLVVMPWILFMVVRPDPFFSAKFVIPIYGMVLGNSMNSCALALERFESGLSDNWKAYYTRISLGASIWEAALPPFRKAMQASLMPQLLTIASMGVVSLPGMMTGQILGGSSAIVAIKYQMMVMAAIFSAVALADFIAIRLYLAKRFDKFYMPKKDIT